MDRKRHLMSRYYMDNAALVWNGNGRNGADEIQKFLASLPISTHLLTSQDVQRIPENARSHDALPCTARSVLNGCAHRCESGGATPTTYRATPKRRLLYGRPS
ncbi:NTF2- export protein 2 [Homalodisca vitripennis]|nr:NTF2- export protein 2 [Homalodisca vitripennis]